LGRPAVIAPDREALDELALRARHGDTEAFDRIVVATSNEMYALALRLTGNEHDARDVVQEAYLRAFRSIRRFRGDAHLTTWLYRIVANCSASHRSKRRRRRETGSFESVVGQLAAESSLDAGSDGVITRVDERTRLVEALDELTDTLRIPIVLHDVYELSHEEIAGILGISRSASKVRLHRARRLLRTTLAEATPRRRKVPKDGVRTERKKERRAIA